jgi:acyl carrier protein
MDTEQTIIEHIRENYLKPDELIDSRTSLFRSQILDSMRLVELISFLEETFGTKIGPMDITLENLDTVSNMQALIKRKTSR